MKIFKNLISMCAACMLVFNSLVIPCAAEVIVETGSEQAQTATTRHNYRTEEFNLPYGGLNVFDGDEYTNRTVALQKEEELRNKGYVLVNTDMKEISDEQYEIIKESGFWFDEYMTTKNKLSWHFDKVYIYKPLLEKYCTNYSKGFTDTLEIRLEIEQSATVIAYEVWYMNDKVGKLSDEFNENIPEWFDGAYLEINSNINCEITLISEEMQCYYRFYISKGTPFVVKLPLSQYNIAEINTVRLPRIEKAISNNNLIYLSKENADRDHAFIVDISKVVNKYKIPMGDISGMPDCSIDKNQTIPEERTVVDLEAISRAQERVQEESEKIKKKQLEEESKTPAEKIQEQKDKSYKKIAAVVTAILFVIWLIKKIINFIKERLGKNTNDEEEIRR